MLENKLFSSTNILEGRITGTSQVTAIEASKGDYNGLVKVSWEAEQVGTSETRYEVARRVKGTDTWATIYKTSGTASSYYYEDVTAFPGQYYDYKVVSITTCEGSDTRLEKSDDGFSRATGIVSGRITYGTGTAVAGIRVALMRGDGTQQQGGQFYALRVSGAGDGVFLSKDSEMLNKYFASKPYTLQMMIRPDDAQTGTIPTILDLGSKLQLTLGAADSNGKGYPLTLKSASASAPTGIYLKPNAFTSLTLAVDAAGAATVTAVNAEDSVTVVHSPTNSAPRCSLPIPTTQDCVSAAVTSRRQTMPSRAISTRCACSATRLSLKTKFSPTTTIPSAEQKTDS